MSWMLMAATVWAAVAVALALLIGRSIRRADEAQSRTTSPAVPDFVPADWVASGSRSR